MQFALNEFENMNYRIEEAKLKTGILRYLGHDLKILHRNIYTFVHQTLCLRHKNNIAHKKRIDFSGIVPFPLHRTV